MDAIERWGLWQKTRILKASAIRFGISSPLCRVTNGSTQRSENQAVGRPDGQLGGRVGERSDGRPDGRTVERAGGQTVGQAAGRSAERAVGRAVGRSNGRWDGRAARLSDGRARGGTSSQGQRLLREGTATINTRTPNGHPPFRTKPQ